MRDIIDMIKRRKLLYISFVLVLMIVLSFHFISSSFSSLQPVRSVEIFSNNVSYQNQEPGSWKVTKSASWTGVGKARITVDVDTVLKTENKQYKDIIMVLDVSGSMNGNKLSRVKEDSIDLINSILTDSNNRIALISFESSSTLLSGLTNDKDNLIQYVSDLSSNGCTNYYSALLNVEEILKNYTKESNRECIVMFLTDGYPNTETPNEVGEYAYLKDTYPYITVNGIQYEMGDTVLEPIKMVSDNQYIASVDTLNNVLFDASVAPIDYDEFTFIDYIDNHFFHVSSIDSISANLGEVSLDGNKVTWTIKDELRSGNGANLVIDVLLNDEYLNRGGVYPTNASEEIISHIKDNDEDVTSDLTPVLQDNYIVTYDGNVPSGCSVNNVPNDEVHSVFSVVSISDTELTCEGYQFKGWDIVTGGIKMINDNYFIMPESDVTLRGVWSKLSISKSIDGTVYEKLTGRLMKQSSGSVTTFGNTLARNSIESVTFTDSIVVPNGVEAWDVSDEKNGSVMAWYIENERGLNDLYIAQEEGVIANQDSSYLFGYMSNLTSINGLEYFDTSNVTSMYSMFNGCSRLTSVDLSHFNTSNVTSMSSMFYNCSGLTELDLSHFDASNVTTMNSMFHNCSGLTELDLSHFNTSKVKNMSAMFNGCSGLISLNISRFDTSSVTTMNSMFYNCRALESLNISSFDTSKVTDMDSMFRNCSGLTSIDLSHFNTSKVTNMSSMFNGCRGLVSLNISNFDTSNVTNMGSMFESCKGLTILNISSFVTDNVTNMSSMFSGCSGLTELGLSHFNTSNVTNMVSMFSGCSGLTSIDLSHFNTSNVTNMASMFYNCSGLTELDLSHFNTSNVTNMASMFYNCSGLTSLNISSFDTSKVTDMHSMFHGCSILTELDLSHFDTSNVTNMSGMFRSCGSLTELDLSHFNTSKVTDMNFMFNYCEKLVDLDVSSFDTSNVTSMAYMFQRCTKLKELDLRSFDVSKVTSSNLMFAAMSSKASGSKVYVKDASVQTFVLGTYLVPSDWDTENVIFE